MTGHLVDTNIPSELTRERPDEHVVSFLRNAGRENIFLSVMTIGEICKGIDSLQAGKKREMLELWLNSTLRDWYAGRILSHRSYR